MKIAKKVTGTTFKKSLKILAIAVCFSIFSVPALANNCTKDGGNKSCTPAINFIYGKWYILDGKYAYKMGNTDGYSTAAEAEADPILEGVKWTHTIEDSNGYIYSWFFNRSDGINGLQIKQEKVIVHCPIGVRYVNGVCEEPSKVLQNSQCVGNPCSITTGNKTLSEVDWQSSFSPLKVKRTYSSLQSGWSFNNGNLAKNDTAEKSQQRLVSKYISQDLIDKGFIYIQPNWQNNPAYYNRPAYITLTRPDGSRLTPQQDYSDKTIAGDTGWFIDRDMSLQLIEGDNQTWQLKNVKTGAVETYSLANPQTSDLFVLSRIDYANGDHLIYNHVNGQVQSITDQRGDVLTYQYNDNNQIIRTLLPNNKQITYTYDNLDRLSTVTRPGYGTKTYVYAEPDKVQNDNPNLLTGIIDENGDRYATYAYDASNRGILTEHADNSQRFELTYNSNNTIVHDENGANRKYNLTLVSGTKRIANQTIGNKTTTNQYDQAGNLTQRTENGITTRHTYDESRNLRTSTITAYNTAESSIILSEWHDSLPVKTKVTEGTAIGDGIGEALRETTYTHDERGNVLTRTITDVQTGKSRTWKYTYNQYNQKLTEKNPQRLTQYWDYTSEGYIQQYTDNQKLITVYSNHNADGKPQTITSPTGQLTTLTYDDAGRVLTQSTTIQNPSLANLAEDSSMFVAAGNFVRRIVNAEEVDNRTIHDITLPEQQTANTTYEYDQVGQLISTTLPDGQIISYTYDDAHRLIGMTDSLGNRIDYTLNSAGDITQTDSFDSQGVLANTSKQVFDNMGRLDEQQGNNGQVTDYNYDNHDNLTQSKDALARYNQSSYNNIGQKLTDTDPTNGQVSYEYDGLGNLIKVTDPKGNATTYRYNAFGDLLETNSPDTGKTRYRYYKKGLLRRIIDGANRKQRYNYNRKGQLTSITDRQTHYLISSYGYDDKGRVVLLTSPTSQTSYIYNSNNQVIEKTQNITANNQTKQQITRYSYTDGGQLKQTRLNSGKLVEYQYQQGKLTGIVVKHDDNDTQLINNLQYSPNGITGYNWSQTNQPVNYSYDLDGRLTNTSDNALNRTLGYDVGNRITNIIDSNGNINFNYQHDNLDRLINQSLDNGVSTDSISYVYDVNSNRTQKTEQATAVNTPVEASSNKYSDYVYDNSGRTLDDGTRQYQYDDAGRIKQITNGSSSGHYVYNALGQRIQKNSNGVTTYFTYDESGQLIGEYDNDGNAIREYIYLGGQPIALMSDEKEGEILQIHTDHLGTPRGVSNASNEILWRMEGDQFGDVQPQVATITMPLRHAGQYADDESGLFYNYFRYYDPATGRYLRSDPIGLEGGLNTYGYVGGSPVHFTDSLGLRWDALGASGGGGARAISIPMPSSQSVGTAGKVSLMTLLSANVANDTGEQSCPRDEDYKKYKDFCGKPPSPTGDHCQDKRNLIHYHRTCADMREAWDNKYKPGRHESDINNHRRKANKIEKQLRNSISCKEFTHG